MKMLLTCFFLLIPIKVFALTEKEATEITQREGTKALAKRVGYIHDKIIETATTGDCYIKNFFESNQVIKVLQQEGFIYKPSSIDNLSNYQPPRLTWGDCK